MSHTDHPKLTRSERTGEGERVHGLHFDHPRKHHKMPTAQQDIRERVLDMLPDAGLTPWLPGIACQRPGVLTTGQRKRTPRSYDGFQRDLIRHGIQSASWREMRLSDCEYGCKEFERLTLEGVVERQVQHNRIYGCRRNDGRIERRTRFGTLIEPVKRREPRRVEFYAPKRMPVTNDAYGDMRRNRTAIAVPENPSLMQMAAARAKNLGITK